MPGIEPPKAVSFVRDKQGLILYTTQQSADYVVCRIGPFHEHARHMAGGYFRAKNRENRNYTPEIPHEERGRKR